MARNSAKRRISIDDEHVLKVVQSYRQEAHAARVDRLALSRRNWDMYYGNVDWSHKQPGQSTEHLPKMANAAEQMAAFVKRGLVAFGDFYSVELPRGSPIASEAARALLRRYLENLLVGRNQKQHISALMANAVKQGLFESLIVLKVHGYRCKEREFVVERGDAVAGIEDELVPKDYDYWRLRIDLVATEDYYPDPTGRGLYEIHRVERDLADVWAMAEAGVYEKSVIAQVEEDMEKEAEARRRDATRNQNQATPPSFRKRCIIEECWGTLLKDDGRPMIENSLSAIINDKYVCRKPQPNPLWHQESPFVAAPIIQNPHTVWSKALYDEVVGMNIALDELFNLILDGGISKVWGIKQIREHWLADPKQVSNGLPQGITLVLNEDAPADGKVVETVSTGEVPPEALAVFNLASSEHDAAAMTNDVRLGQLPPGGTKATSVLATEQNNAVMLDAFVNGLEVNVIVPLLRKSWLTILQNADDIPAEDVVDAIGVGPAFALSNMSPAERFATFAKGIKFKADGLSATLAKARDFQKIMALVQVTGTFPPLLEAFVRRLSPDKFLDNLMRMLNLNPETFGQTAEEQAALPSRLRNMQALQQIAPSQGGRPSAGGAGGDRSLPNEARSDASAGVESEAGYGST